MTRLPLALSALALVVAIFAAVGAYREKPVETPALDEAAVAAMIDERVEAAQAAMSEAQPEATEAQTLDPEAIGPIVRDYMLAHPELLEEVLAALEDKRERDQVAAQSEALKTHSDAIFRSPGSPEGGNPAGNVTLVEFFDYNCGYCKRMLPAIVDLLKTDPNLRVVFKEWPVLTEGSAEAARIALGVQKVAPESYLEFHTQLMGLPGGGEGIGEEQALALVDKLGLDKAAIEAAAKDPAIDAIIGENFEIAEALGLRGTPSYVVGDAIIPGAVSFEALQEKIAAARDNCETC